MQVRKARRARRRGPPTPLPVKATRPNQVWTYDLLDDRCLNGTRLRILTVMDEFTREGLAIEVATSFPSHRVVAVLERLVARHGPPHYMRSDNGSEFIALAVRGWLARQDVGALYIDPGCPWQNGYGESLNGTVRDECLNLHLFISVTEAQARLEAFRQHDNAERPHSSLAYQAPLEFKRAWEQAQVEPGDPNIDT